MIIKEFINSSLSKKKIKQILSDYHKYLFFLFFVVLVSIFWLLHKLTKEYSVHIQAKPNIYSTDKYFSYEDIGNNTLYLNVRSTGYSILVTKWFKRKLVNINVDKLDIGSEYLSIATSTIKEYIPESLTKMDVLNIDPDSIRFKITGKRSKKIPITAIYDLHLVREYKQSGDLILSPDSVTISGPKELLDRYSEYKLNITLDKYQSKSIENIVAVNNLEGDIVVTPKRVRYKIPVDRCTEKEIELPLTLINAPENTTITSFPEKIKVRYSIPLKDFVKASIDEFQVAVDYNDIVNSRSRQSEVKVIKKSAEAFDLRIDPEFVQCLINK